MTETPPTPDTDDRRRGRSIVNAKRIVALDLLLGAISADDPDLLDRAYRAVLDFHRDTYGGDYAIPAVGEVTALATRFEVDLAHHNLPAARIDAFLADPSTGVHRERPTR